MLVAIQMYLFKLILPTVNISYKSLISLRSFQASVWWTSTKRLKFMRIVEQGNFNIIYHISIWGFPIHAHPTLAALKSFFFMDPMKNGWHFLVLISFMSFNFSLLFSLSKIFWYNFFCQNFVKFSTFSDLSLVQQWFLTFLSRDPNFRNMSIWNFQKIENSKKCTKMKNLEIFKTLKILKNIQKMEIC